MSLNAEQLHVLNTIKRRARIKHASPKEVKAAIETGIVEANLTNPSAMTDHDSQGWRQERKSLYKDPTNLVASIDRFFDETRAVKAKYGTAGALAAAVQRPAAQYRGRYQEHSSEADSLLGGLASMRSGSGSTAQTSSNSADVAAVTDRNRKRAIVGNLIAKHNPKSLLITSGVLAPIPVPELKTTTTSSSSPKVSAPGGKGKYKTAMFEGHMVRADWIPAFKYARAHGWEGSIQSGVRTYAEQKKLYARYKAGGNIAAKPGESNHEIENGGAVDVSDPTGLHHALASFDGVKPIWALSVGLNDSVHFSSTGH